MADLAHQFVTEYGAAALFALLMFGIVGLPLPDEAIMVGAGFLVRQGHLRLLPLYLAGVAGSICGITVSFLIGRGVGFDLVHNLGHRLRLTHERFERFRGWYERSGRWVLLVGYFVPGVRHLVAIAAGMSLLPWRTFALFAYTGALLWVTTFLAAGCLLAQGWADSSALARRYASAALTVAALVVLIAAMVRWTRRRRERNAPSG
jgi:membrane protein DedA with SNARE-associated domain